jgi:hypothetical protein
MSSKRFNGKQTILLFSAISKYVSMVAKNRFLDYAVNSGLFLAIFALKQST